MLRRMGVVFVDHMPGQKVRIKLILALSKTKNLKEVRTMFLEK
jgi:L-asparaginase